MTTPVRRSLVRATQIWRQTRKQAVPVPVMQRQMSTSTDSESVVQKKLLGKVAIVTGSAGGIGAATAKLFAAHGAHVIIADIQDELGGKTAQQIGPKALYRHCDVTREEDISSTVDFAVKEFGKLDIMHNNAGVYPVEENFWTLDMKNYDQVTAVNVRGVVMGIKHAARVMVPAKKGVILNTASMASVCTGNIMSLIYNINKMNHPGLTKVAAFHLGKHGIRVNCISPTGIPTDMSDALLRRSGIVDLVGLTDVYSKSSCLENRSCTQDDFAKAALFLCSDDSGYISGHNLLLDGGLTNVTSYDPFNFGEPAKLRDV